MNTSNKKVFNNIFKNLDSIQIIVIILCIIFLIIFLYCIFINNNKLIKFRVTKEPILKNNVDYDYLKDKYNFKNCTNMCKQEFCDEYLTQQIKYDLCKECNKENKCYDQNEGICVPCKNNYTCEQLFGCNKNPPINPLKNFCTRCWQK